MARGRLNAGGIGSVDIWTALRSSAVCPGLRQARTARRSEAVGGFLYLRNGKDRCSLRRTVEGRPRYRPLDELCRTGSRPVLSAAGRAACQRFLCPIGRSEERRVGKEV